MVMLLQCSSNAAAARAFMVKLLQVNHTKSPATQRVPCDMHEQCYMLSQPLHSQGTTLFPEHGTGGHESMGQERLTGSNLLIFPHMSMVF